jgi:hypothetical protein
VLRYDSLNEQHGEIQEITVIMLDSDGEVAVGRRYDFFVL